MYLFTPSQITTVQTRGVGGKALSITNHGESPRKAAFTQQMPSGEHKRNTAENKQFRGIHIAEPSVLEGIEFPGTRHDHCKGP
jgi:hypothetical protein